MGKNDETRDRDYQKTLGGADLKVLSFKKKIAIFLLENRMIQKTELYDLIES